MKACTYLIFHYGGCVVPQWLYVEELGHGIGVAYELSMITSHALGSRRYLRHGLFISGQMAVKGKTILVLR